jgi:hypothetical protein
MKWAKLFSHDDYHNYQVIPSKSLIYPLEEHYFVATEGDLDRR